MYFKSPPCRVQTLPPGTSPACWGHCKHSGAGSLSGPGGLGHTIGSFQNYHLAANLRQVLTKNSTLSSKSPRPQKKLWLQQPPEETYRGPRSCALWVCAAQGWNRYLQWSCVAARVTPATPPGKGQQSQSRFSQAGPDPRRPCPPPRHPHRPLPEPRHPLSHSGFKPPAPCRSPSTPPFSSITTGASPLSCPHRPLSHYPIHIARSGSHTTHSPKPGLHCLLPAALRPRRLCPPHHHPRLAALQSTSSALPLPVHTAYDLLPSPRRPLPGPQPPVRAARFPTPRPHRPRPARCPGSAPPAPCRCPRTPPALRRPPVRAAEIGRAHV